MLAPGATEIVGSREFVARPRARVGLVVVICGLYAAMSVPFLLSAMRSTASPADNAWVSTIMLTAGLFGVLPIVLWLSAGSERLLVSSSGVVLERRILGLAIWRASLPAATIEAVSASAEPIRQKLTRSYWEKYFIEGDSTVVLTAAGRSRVWSGAWRLHRAEADAIVATIEEVCGRERDAVPNKRFKPTR